MLFTLGAKAQFIDVVDDVAQGVAAADFVLDLAKNFADFVFDGVGAGGALPKAVQVGKECAVDKVHQVVAGERPVVVDLAVLVFGRGPAFPAICRVQNVAVGLAFKRGFGRLVPLQPVEVFEEQQPRGLLGVIQLGGAAALFPERVVDIFEGLFKHALRLSGKAAQGQEWW